MLQQDLALIYWDIDQSFFSNPIHDAGLFTRAHKANWTYFTKQPFNWLTDYYSKEKHISVIGAPKNIGQIKYIGELLDRIQNKNASLKNTAIVLGDENLLMPLLNSIPNQIDTLNITMGLPLRLIPLTSLFEALFKIHKTTSQTLYYKDVIAMIISSICKSVVQE